MTDLYLIWSYEHRAWWRPKSCGYTWDVYLAGLYRKEEAEEIVAGHTDPVHEVMLPARAVFGAFEVDAERCEEMAVHRRVSLRRCRQELRLPESEGDPVKLAEQRQPRNRGGWGG